MRFTLDLKLVKKITTLAVPAVMAMLTQTAINLLDTAMVGRLPGAVGINGVAAIGLSLPVFWALGGFLSAIAIGTQAITARRVGEGELKLAGRVLTNALVVAVFSGLAVSLAGYFYIPQLFPLLNPNPEVARLAGDYCRLRMLGIFSMVTTTAYKGFFDGIGKTYVHLVASVVMNLTNAFLNAVLIFGLLGFPRLEVQGAALASLISTFIGLGTMIAWSLFSTIRKNFNIYSLRNLKGKIMREIVRLSLPSGLATVFVMSGFEFFFWVVANLPSEPMFFAPLAFLPLLGSVIGVEELTQPDIASSASWVIISCLMLVFMTSIAMGTATATLVSQSLGARNPELAERYGWESVKLGMYIMGALGLVAIFTPHFLLGIFTDKEQVIVGAQPSMRLMGAVFSLMSAGLILVQALFGAGATTFVMVAEMLMHGLCLVPLSYLLSTVVGLGLVGAWVAAAIYVLLLSSIMAWKFYGGSWKKIHL